MFRGVIPAHRRGGRFPFVRKRVEAPRSFSFVFVMQSTYPFGVTFARGCGEAPRAFPLYLRLKSINQVSQKATPSSMMPFPSTITLLRPRGLEGGFLCRKDKPSWLRQISMMLARLEVGGASCRQVKSGRRYPASPPYGVLPKFSPSFPTPADRFP